MSIATDLMAMYYAQTLDTMPKPVVKISLNEWTGYADTGQQITLMNSIGPTMTTYKGYQCGEFPYNANARVAYPFKPYEGNAGNHIDIHLACCGWIACASNTNWRGAQCFGIGGGWSTYAIGNGFGVFYNTNPGVNCGGLVASGTLDANSRINAPTDTNWHHFAVNFRTIDPLWTSANFTIEVYIDGVYKGTYTKNMYNRLFDSFFLGNWRRESNTITSYQRDLRAYNRELTAEQIQKIYEEGL